MAVLPRKELGALLLQAAQDSGEGLRLDADRKRLLGLSYEAAMPGAYWIDEKRAAIQALLDKQPPSAPRCPARPRPAAS